MEQQFLKYGLPKETVPDIMMLNKKHESNGSLARLAKKYICNIYVNHLPRFRNINVIDLMKENSFIGKQKGRSRPYPPENITEADN